ncbi:hypothetical protein ACWD7M_16630 [Streptomyces griseus]
MQVFNKEGGAREIERLLMQGISSVWGEDSRQTTVFVEAELVMPTPTSSFKVEIRAVAFDDNKTPAVSLCWAEHEFSRSELLKHGSSIGQALRSALDKTAGES